MLRILLSLTSLLAACTPSPQKAAMPNPSPVAGSAAADAANAGLEQQGSASPGPLTESPAEAAGRRILSTAFVKVGPDRSLTVELHDGRVLILRDVVMRPKDYCGVLLSGGSAAARYCGGYAEVAAARPGGAPDASNSVEAARGSANRK